jgi:hypothetical protein
MGPIEFSDERLIPDHLFKEVRDRTNFTYNYGIRDLEIDHGLMVLMKPFFLVLLFPVSLFPLPSSLFPSFFTFFIVSSNFS